MFFEEFAKAFHPVLKIWKSVDGRLRKCANHFGPKNGLFSLADFHYNALADFAQIFTEGAQGPQNVSTKNSGGLSHSVPKLRPFSWILAIFKSWFFADFLLKTWKYGKVDLSKIVAHPKIRGGQVLQNFLSGPPYGHNLSQQNPVPTFA